MGTRKLSTSLCPGTTPIGCTDAMTSTSARRWRTARQPRVMPYVRVSARVTALPHQYVVWLAGKEIAMNLPTTAQVLTLLKTGTPDERIAFVKRLPPTDFQD